MTGMQLGKILARKGYRVREGEHIDTEKPAAAVPVVRQPTLLAPRCLSFILPMPVSANDAWHSFVDKGGNVRKTLTDEHRRFRSEVIYRVRKVMRDAPPLEGRLELVLRILQAGNRRMDIDNRVKPLQDALTEARAYVDDSQIDRLVIERVRIDQAEECTVDIREIA